MKKNDICPICKSNSWKETFHAESFSLLISPCGLIKTRILKRDQNFPTNDLYESNIEVEKHFKSQSGEFQNFASLVLDFLPQKSGDLLDVGCGFGWIVKEAKKRGFVALGIDQSKTYTTFGKNKLKVDLKNVSLEKFTTQKKFDIIILNHVLEHIAGPNKFLQKVRQLLKSDGMLFVACPNIDSLMFMLFKARWYGLQPYQHIWQFSPDSLERLIEANGFKTVKIRTKNLNYQVTGLKGIVFKALTAVAPAYKLGDQVFILVKRHA